MKPEIKEKWLAALRSGEYKQGKEALLVEDKEGNPSYCCLGVLCDLYSKEANLEAGWDGNEFHIPEAELVGDIDDDGDSIEKLEDIYEETELPSPVQEWSGLRSPAGSLEKPVKAPAKELPVKTLAEANDNGLTFLEIADIIEEQL